MVENGDATVSSSPATTDLEGIVSEKENETKQQQHQEQPDVLIDPMEIGDRCVVTWRDGSKKLATIVERRPCNHRKRAYLQYSFSVSGGTKKSKDDVLLSSSENEPSCFPGGSGGGGAKSVKNDDLSNLKADEMEYYVHYSNHDRRLDEWLKVDKFELDTLDRINTQSSSPSSSPSPSSNRRSRHSKRRKTEEETTQGGSVDQSLAALEREHEEITKVKNISKIVMGCWEVEAWYFSPYPEEYAQEDTLFVCEFCLKYMKHRRTLRKHKAECAMRSPPGNEIYREKSLSVFEVDGKEHRIYSQNLCLLAKLFLDHKTLYYDVEPFFFYIITEVDDQGAHIVGYFSKEKVSAEDYNLACILTFPQYQKCGYGKFIISLSYELSKREKKPGSPEKPLSDLGKISYRSYWTHVMMTLLATSPNRKSLGIRDISNLTAIKTEDIISTLQSLDMVKFWKGQHVVYVREEIVQNYMKQKKLIRLCKGECLDWEPHSQRKKNDGSNN